LQVEAFLEIIRGYHQSPHLTPAIGALVIGGLSAAFYVLMPVIFGGYFRSLERFKGGWRRQVVGWVVGLVYILLGSGFLGLMLISLAYFILWEAGETVWQVGGLLLMLGVVVLANFLHRRIRRRSFSGASLEAEK